MEHLPIRFEPFGIIVSAQRNETLYAAAQRAHLPVGHACPQEGSCGRCGLRILAGTDNLSPETPAERRTKAANRVDPALRLSCLARIEGPVTATADYW